MKRTRIHIAHRRTELCTGECRALSVIMRAASTTVVFHSLDGEAGGAWGTWNGAP